MPLTDADARNAKPSAKTQKLFDGGGMYLEISPAGGKWWRLKYRFGGKEKRLSLGTYPDTGLKEARARREQMRRLLAEGFDPGEVRKDQKAAGVERAANSFEAVAREWFTLHESTWAPSHASKIIGRFMRDVFPWIGGKPIAEVATRDITGLLHRIITRGRLETAHRVKQITGQVFAYAIARGLCDRNPVVDLGREALPPRKGKHFAALTDPQSVAALLRAMDAFRGTLEVASALRLAPLLFVRPGELRAARWADMDLEAAEWRFTVPKTKTEHLVPLAPQAVAILRELHPLTGHRVHVFPGRDPKKCMSEAAINAALRRMGYDTQKDLTGHGFRAMARTLIHERLKFPAEVIEHQLAHRVPDALGAAYNRTRFIDERRKMMTAWADYLDVLKQDEGNVIPISAAQGRK